MNIKYYLLGIAAFTVTLLSGCNDFLDITPTGKVIPKTGEQYRNLLTYSYKYFPKDRGLTTLRSDEMALGKAYTSELDYNTYFDIWRWNDDAPATTTASFGWRRYYHAIYTANYIISHRNNITQASKEEINQLVGEAYMMRAYCHFLLVNLYALPYTHTDPDTTRGVPVMTDANVNIVPKSSKLQTVYTQILKDIDAAAENLNVEKWETGKNYRFNVISAQALRARVYLYMGKWQQALDAAMAVIKAHGALEDLNSSKVLPNDYQSVESIVALEQIMPNDYSVIGRPSASLLTMYGTGDLRKNMYYKRITSSASTLTKGGSEQYNCTFRSAEFYLIAAEAEANLNHLSNAVDYIGQLLQKRYDADNYPVVMARIQKMNQNELIAEIANERYRELAFEGHRWFDLRRTTMPALNKVYNTETFTLKSLDSRYTLRLPTEALEANPAIELIESGK